MPKGQKKRRALDNFPEYQDPFGGTELANISDVGRRLGYATIGGAQTTLLDRNADTFPTPRIAATSPDSGRETLLWDAQLAEDWDTERRQVYGYGSTGPQRKAGAASPRREMVPDPAYRFGVVGPPSPHPVTGAPRPRADAHLLGLRPAPPVSRGPGLVAGNGTAGPGRPFADLLRTQRPARKAAEDERATTYASYLRGQR